MTYLAEYYSTSRWKKNQSSSLQITGHIKKDAEKECFHVENSLESLSLLTRNKTFGGENPCGQTSDSDSCGPIS